MNREIKFRAWDKEQNNMWLWEDLIDKQCTYLNSKYFVAMQYTGLKDKNGKEVYEGDIIRVNNEKMELVFRDGYFGWGKQHKGMYSFDPFGCEEIEVIGNIYENPELLNNN
jgi:hypothetical protein